VAEDYKLNMPAIKTNMNNMGNISRVISRVSKRYNVERLTLEKKSSLISFFKEAYADQFNASEFKSADIVRKRWNWVNFLNPNLPDNQLPTWLCTSNGRIVGHFGIIPVFLKVGDKYNLSAWGRDLIILPRFRKLGIGPFLVDKVIAQIKQDISPFMVGGLNKDVYTIYKKFRFVDLGHVPSYVRIYNLPNVLRAAFPRKALLNALGVLGIIPLKLFYLIFRQKMRKNIQINKIAKFDESFDELWERASVHFPVIIKRDTKTLNWRFVNQPYWKYDIFKAEERGMLKGYIVLRRGISRGLRIGVISDFLASPKDAETISSLVRFAVKYFERGAPIDAVKCNVLHNAFEDALKKGGFIKTRSNARFLFTACRDPKDLALISNPKNWFITYGDSDLDLS